MGQTYDQLALSELLADALNALRPSEKEIIILKDVEERPYADIADIMNISLSAAKMRVQRARLALQREYKLRSDVTESHTIRQPTSEELKRFVAGDLDTDATERILTYLSENDDALETVDTLWQEINLTPPEAWRGARTGRCNSGKVEATALRPYTPH